jgi:methionine sulfoxide reductase heme-binding subunit
MLASTLTSNATWYLMRATGAVSLILLTTVLVLGIATANRYRPGKRPVYVTAAVHRSVALLSIAFLAVHVVTALIDPYAMVGLAAVVVPFVAAGHPLQVGLGALALDLLIALIGTSLLRKHVGVRTWRAVHWVAYLCWPVAFVHGLTMGTDTASLWMAAVDSTCLGAIGGAVAWRLLGPRATTRATRARAAA